MRLPPCSANQTPPLPSRANPVGERIRGDGEYSTNVPEVGSNFEILFEEPSTNQTTPSAPT